MQNLVLRQLNTWELVRVTRWQATTRSQHICILLRSPRCFWFSRNKCPFAKIGYLKPGKAWSLEAITMPPAPLLSERLYSRRFYPTYSAHLLTYWPPATSISQGREIVRPCRIVLKNTVTFLPRCRVLLGADWWLLASGFWLMTVMAGGWWVIAAGC